MKKFKKIFAVLLTLAMVLGMSMTSFAAELTAKITVNNAGDNAKFKYLQVIKADPTTETGWAFATGQIANNYKTVFTNKTDQQILKEMINGTASASDIASALKNVKDANYSLSTETVSPISVNAAGVYYIEGSEADYNYNPMAAYVSFSEYNTATGIPASLADTSVEAKRQTSKVEKSSNSTNAVTEIGRTVTYTVESVVPYIPATDTNPKYIVKDTIQGADYVTVAEGDNEGKVAVSLEIGEINTTIYATVENNNSFTVDLSSYLENNTHANKDVVLTYQAVVTDVKVGNTVIVGDGSNDGESKYGSDTDNSYTGNITLTKYASDDNNDELSDNAKLAGAGFKVSKIVDGKTSYATFTNNKLTGWVSEEKDGTEVTTGEDGTLKVEGLASGTYTFKEVTAPTGYHINETPTVVELTVSGTATDVFSATGNMIDSTLSSLPSTGGIGTTIFTIGGCAIMIIAAALFFASRRKAAK